jgi:hypothetical protein
MPEFSAIRRRRTRVLAGVVGVLILVAPASQAQTSAVQSAPAYVRIVEGSVLLDRELGTESVDVGMPFVPGDRLRTTRGRAEVLFPDGTALDLDEFTEVDLQSAQALRLVSGRVWVAVPLEANGQLQIDTPAATAYSDGAGEFRVALLGVREPQTEVVVARGRAELVGDRGSVKLVGGERSVAIANDVPSRPQVDARRSLEAFDEWARALREDQSSGRSTQYLPPDLRVYSSTLDQSGSWQYDASYGYIWYPTVDTTWRPYYSGYWATVPAYGWTWIGYERWAWPTHHYGRWGHAHNRWFWIPERHWGSAWVSWGAAPGYVSWCPLGYDNRPVSGWSVSVGTTWGGGWVVLPRERFGIAHERVGHYAVAPHSLPRQTPFVMQNTPPVLPPQNAVRRVAQPGSPSNAGGPGVRAADQAYPRGDRSRGPGYSAASQNSAEPTRRNGATLRQPAPGLPAASSSMPASGANTVRPRGPSRMQPPASVTSPDSRPASDPRSYPFGDFRRRGAQASQGDQSDSVSVGPRAFPRSRNPALAPGNSIPNQLRRETPVYQPSPAVRSGAIPRRTEPEGQPATPPSRPSYGGRTERAESPSTGAATGAPRAGTGGAVGRAVPRAPQQDGGRAVTPRGGDPGSSRGGDAGQAGDGGARHARPR